MAKHEVDITCWTCGHVETMIMNRRQEDSLEKKIPEMKAVCPRCRAEERGNQPIFISRGETLYNPGKVFICEHGHVNVVGAFNNGWLHIRTGHRSHTNIEGRIEDMETMLDSGDLSCQYEDEEENVCTGKLTAIDDSFLSYAGEVSFKTRVRVGDLWDKNGIDPVRPGHYDGDGHYHQTKSEKSNKDRLRKMQKRNTPESKMPGKRLDKPTDKIYNRKPKQQ